MAMAKEIDRKAQNRERKREREGKELFCLFCRLELTWFPSESFHREVLHIEDEAMRVYNLARLSVDIFYASCDD